MCVGAVFERLVKMGAINNHKDVKYSTLENGQQPDVGNSSGFGKSIKFVAMLAVVIILFTCTSWAFHKPGSPKTQAGIHSFSYEQHREMEIIFSSQSQRHQEQLGGNNSASIKDPVLETPPSRDHEQTTGVNSQAKDDQDKPQTGAAAVPDTAVKSQGSSVAQKKEPIKTLFSSLKST